MWSKIVTMALLTSTSSYVLADTCIVRPFLSIGYELIKVTALGNERNMFNSFEAAKQAMVKKIAAKECALDEANSAKVWIGLNKTSGIMLNYVDAYGSDSSQYGSLDSALARQKEYISLGYKKDPELSRVSIKVGNGFDVQTVDWQGVGRKWFDKLQDAVAFKEALIKNEVSVAAEMDGTCELTYTEKGYDLTVVSSSGSNTQTFPDLKLALNEMYYYKSYDICETKGAINHCEIQKTSSGVYLMVTYWGGGYNKNFATMAEAEAHKKLLTDSKVCIQD